VAAAPAARDAGRPWPVTGHGRTVCGRLRAYRRSTRRAVRRDVRRATLRDPNIVTSSVDVAS